MKKLLLSFAVILSVFLMVFVTMVGKSEALTFYLDCDISSSGCTSTSTLGTIALTDNSNYVDVFVDITGVSVYDVHEILLNYNDALFSNSSGFATIPADFGVIVGENNKKADGYSSGKFDLKQSQACPRR